MIAVSRVNKLDGYSDTVSGLAHTALKHVADPEFTPNSLHVNGLALVGEARISCDNKQRGVT